MNNINNNNFSNKEIYKMFNKNILSYHVKINI